MLFAHRVQRTKRWGLEESKYRGVQVCTVDNTKRLAQEIDEMADSVCGIGEQLSAAHSRMSRGMRTMTRIRSPSDCLYGTFGLYQWSMYVQPAESLRIIMFEWGD